MKALRFYDVQDLRYEDAPDPVIEKPDDVIVKVKAVGICGSDIARYRNLGPYVPGNVWGHEFCGEVVEVGEGVKNLKPGDRVVGCPNMVCHECEYCKSGHPSRCENLNTIGAYVPGAYAEYIKLPEINFVKMADSMSYEQGACDSWSVSDKYQNGIRSSCCRMWKYRSDGNRMGESFRSKESICN